jgi:hypothetical protein
MGVEVAVGMAALSAYQANEQAKAANKAADAQIANAKQRYALDSAIAENQMEEQNSIAMEKMTDVSRAFLKARGTAKVQQAESGVSGNVEQRIKSVSKLKESDAKGKIAKEVDTNNVNIAQGMLAKKIDTEAMIADADSKRQNVMLNTLVAGASGAASGYALGSSFTQTKGIGDIGALVTPSGGRPGTGSTGGR